MCKVLSHNSPHDCHTSTIIKMEFSIQWSNYFSDLSKFLLDSERGAFDKRYTGQELTICNKARYHLQTVSDLSNTINSALSTNPPSFDLTDTKVVIATNICHSFSLLKQKMEAMIFNLQEMEEQYMRTTSTLDTFLLIWNRRAI